MTVEEQVLQLPKKEKLKIMESLWIDLSSDPESIDSPAWHGEELRRTKERLDRGEEEILDWKAVREELLRSSNEG